VIEFKLSYASAPETYRATFENVSADASMKETRLIPARDRHHACRSRDVALAGGSVVARSDAADAAPSRTTDVAPFDPLTPTIFHQRWWLDAASKGRYDEVLVMAGNRIVGRLPYVMERIDPFRIVCAMPELTHFLGPAIDEGNGLSYNRAVRRREITRQLLRKIPKCSGFWHKMHLGVPDMLAFQECSYRVSVQFTYEIMPEPEPVIWANMRDKTRNVIRRARERFSVSEISDPAEFVHAYTTNLKHRGARNVYDEKTIHLLCSEARSRDAGRILAARDSNGRINAAIFCVWDARVAYYLMSTRTHDAGNGAVSLLLWHTILDCSNRGIMFDFDGIGGKPTNSHFFNGFGGRIAPRFIASRYTFAHTALDRLTERISMLGRSGRKTGHEEG
jgi:hypothetical protein